MLLTFKFQIKLQIFRINYNYKKLKISKECPSFFKLNFQVNFNMKISMTFRLTNKQTLEMSQRS